MTDNTHRARPDREAEWDALRAKYLLSREDRPPSTGRGVHHVALVSSDVEQTIRFYQEVLEFPLTELFENPRLSRVDTLLLRHRPRERTGILRLPGSRRRRLRRSARRAPPSGDFRRAGDVGPAQGQTRRTEDRLRPHPRQLALLPRPQRGAARTHFRSARRDVRIAGDVTVPGHVRCVDFTHQQLPGRIVFRPDAAVTIGGGEAVEASRPTCRRFNCRNRTGTHRCATTNI